MPRTSRALIVSLLWLLATFLPLSRSSVAQTVWSGLTKTFTKDGGTDDTLPENQDQLTDNVALTRGDQGLINIVAESSFELSSSPADTEWATNLNNPSQPIVATNWSNLAFTNWLNAYGGSRSHGSFIANRDAVVHLITDDVYLDLRFTDWETGGGSFTYMRAEPATALPTTGDYNGNHAVDAADYLDWRKTLTQSVTPFGSGADGFADGTIDGNDYTFWRQRFGNSVASSSATGSLEFTAAVPEPATITLLLAGMLCFQRRRSKSYPAFSTKVEHTIMVAQKLRRRSHAK